MSKKCVVIEDDQQTRKIIVTVVNSYVEDLEVVGQAGTVGEGISVVLDNSPDILLMDVDLPDGNAFDILRKLDYKKYTVIFITAYQEHAVNAIKFSAFDYLLKPFKPTELVEALNRALKKGYEELNQVRFEAAFDNFSGSLPELKKIVLKTSDKIYLVNIKDIIYCQSDNNYTVFHLFHEKKLMVSKSLKTYEELLSKAGFIRVHQSYLINLNYVSCFNKTDGGYLILSNNEQIPVSTAMRKHLLARFEEL